MDTVTHLLDTHTVLWAYENSALLGEESRAVIARAPSFSLGVSDITLLEIALLATKNRITLNISLVTLFRKIERDFVILPLDGSAAALAYEIDLPQADFFDRVIVATAVCRRIALLTKDRSITEAGVVPVIW